MRYFHYTDGTGVIRIRARYQPSEKGRRIWVVRELKGKEWVLPCIPEITWGTLKDMEYLGSVKTQSEGERAHE